MAYMGVDKKEQIIAALAELSRTRGFYRVTMDELAAQAGVSKRTIYRHFRSKDEIVEAVLDRFTQRMAGIISQTVAAAGKPSEVLSGVVGLVVKHVQSTLNPLVLDDLRRYYPDLWQKLDRFRAEKIQENVLDVLAKDFAGKGLREVDPRIFGTAFLAAVQAVVNPAFILDNNLTPEYTVKQLTGIFLYGILDDRPDRAPGPGERSTSG